MFGKKKGVITNIYSLRVDKLIQIKMSFAFFEFSTKVLIDELETIEWCEKYNLLANSRKFSCGLEMQIFHLESVIDKYV